MCTNLHMDSSQAQYTTCQSRNRQNIFETWTKMVFEGPKRTSKFTWQIKGNLSLQHCCSTVTSEKACCLPFSDKFARRIFLKIEVWGWEITLRQVQGPVSWHKTLQYSALGLKSRPQSFRVPTLWPWGTNPCFDVLMLWCLHVRFHGSFEGSEATCSHWWRHDLPGRNWRPDYRKRGVWSRKLCWRRGETGRLSGNRFFGFVLSWHCSHTKPARFEKTNIQQVFAHLLIWYLRFRLWETCSTAAGQQFYRPNWRVEPFSQPRVAGPLIQQNHQVRRVLTLTSPAPAQVGFQDRKPGWLFQAHWPLFVPQPNYSAKMFESFPLFSDFDETANRESWWHPAT